MGTRWWSAHKGSACDPPPGWPSKPASQGAQERPSATPFRRTHPLIGAGRSRARECRRRSRFGVSPSGAISRSKLPQSVSDAYGEDCQSCVTDAAGPDALHAEHGSPHRRGSWRHLERDRPQRRGPRSQGRSSGSRVRVWCGCRRSRARESGSCAYRPGASRCCIGVPLRASARRNRSSAMPLADSGTLPMFAEISATPGRLGAAWRGRSLASVWQARDAAPA